LFDSTGTQQNADQETPKFEARALPSINSIEVNIPVAIRLQAENYTERRMLCLSHDSFGIKTNLEIGE